MDGSRVDIAAAPALQLRQVAAYRGIRVLAWHGEVLYGCRGYKIVRLRPGIAGADWELIARLQPSWWRNLTSRAALTSRLVRDGFHALAVLDDGTMIGATPGAFCG